MLLEHRRPLVAYLLCAVLCAVVLITSMGDVERVPDRGLTGLADPPVTPSGVLPTVVAATQLGREVTMRTAREVLVPSIAVITEAAGGAPWSVPAAPTTQQGTGGADQPTVAPDHAQGAADGAGGSGGAATGGGSGAADGSSGSGSAGSAGDSGGSIASPGSTGSTGSGGEATVDVRQPQGNAHGHQQGSQGSQGTTKGDQQGAPGNAKDDQQASQGDVFGETKSQGTAGQGKAKGPGESKSQGSPGQGKAKGHAKSH